MSEIRPNAYNETAIMFASSNGHAHVAVLLENNAELNLQPTYRSE